jgi:hypothetical protein
MSVHNLNECASIDDSESPDWNWYEQGLKIDDMTKWISSLEDKVTHVGQKVESTTEAVHSTNTRMNEFDKTLKKVLEKVEEIHGELRLKNVELVRCNRLLAEKLSKKLYHSDYKKQGISDPKAAFVVAGSLHPDVIPFVYLDDKSGATALLAVKSSLPAKS